jgi:hypothetical protein
VIEPVLLDTGPLVAILHKRDEQHHRCVQAWKTLKAQFITCWPVLTEAAWLIRSRPDDLQRLLRGVNDGAYVTADLPRDAAQWIAAFLARYADNRTQLADAALMYLAEQFAIKTVFTLDRRDFSVYRTSDGRSLRVLP